MKKLVTISFQIESDLTAEKIKEIVQEDMQYRISEIFFDSGSVISSVETEVLIYK